MTERSEANQVTEALGPIEFAFLTRERADAHGQDYELVCAVCGLPPTEEGWGLLSLVEDGERVTRATDDLDYLRTLIAFLADLRNGELDPADRIVRFTPDKFVMRREGWPDAWWAEWEERQN